MFEDIKDKVVVLTGGCGVFGSVFSMALINAGAKVSILDYKQGRCEECLQGISKQKGAPVFCAVANVLDKESLLKAKKEINEKFGKIDILINGAGGNSPTATTKDEEINEDNINDLSKTFFGLDMNGFRNVFDLNFLGTMLPSMVFAEDMLMRGGAIVNISSMNSFRPLTKIPAYSAAKASVNNFTQWLAVHLAKTGVRVNAIAPGFFLTHQNRFLLVDEKTGMPTPRGRKIMATTPVGKYGDPQDLQGAVLFLLSDLSSFITGVVLPVDGGYSAYGGV